MTPNSQTADRGSLQPLTEMPEERGRSSPNAEADLVYMPQPVEPGTVYVQDFNQKPSRSSKLRHNHYRFSEQPFQAVLDGCWHATPRLGIVWSICRTRICAYIPSAQCPRAQSTNSTQTILVRTLGARHLPVSLYTDVSTKSTTCDLSSAPGR
jgi:hypothetical protein